MNRKLSRLFKLFSIVAAGLVFISACQPGKTTTPTPDANQDLVASIVEATLTAFRTATYRENVPIAGPTVQHLPGKQYSCGDTLTPM